MRKASVHPRSGLSEEPSATALPHADPRHSSELTTNTHSSTDMQTCGEPVHVNTQVRTFSLSLPPTDKHRQDAT